MSTSCRDDGVYANMIVLAQARREGGEVVGLQSSEVLTGSGVSSGIKVVSLPEFVPRGEVAAVTVCLHAVASGEYTGIRFAELLQRAEMRCEVASGVEGLSLSVAEASGVYVAAVSRVDKGFGWSKDFVSEVADLAVVVGVSSRMSGLGRVDELDSAVRLALDMKVVGENVVVATPSVVGSSDDARLMHDDYRVIPVSIYRSLVRLSARVIGSSVFVSMSRSVDGVYRLENDFNCSSCYSIASLPRGRYLLPGGFGRLVTAEFMCGVLEGVVALPILRRTDGFCYMGVLPPSVRLRAVAVLGKDPSVMNLTNFFPEAYDWCSGEAVVSKAGLSGDNPVYHVETSGTLPSSLPVMARIGMVDRYGSELSAHTDKLLNDIFSGVSSAQGRSGSVPNIYPQVVVDSRGGVDSRRIGSNVAALQSSSSLSTSVRVPNGPQPFPVIMRKEGPRLVPPARDYRHARSVSESGLTMSNRVVLDMGVSSAFRPVWQDVENPRARMWITRLGEGAPIDTRCLIDLTKVKASADLPVPPASVSGTSVMVRPDSALRSGGGKLVAWDRRALVIPGCTVEYAKVSSVKGKRFVVVHPLRGVICRYDLNFDHSVVVNEGLNVSSVDCVLWLHGDASFHVVGAGTVVRTWFDDGMPGLGAMATSMMFAFGATAVRMYGGEIHAERVIGLELKSVDAEAGLVRFYKRFRMKPSVERVHLYAFDEVVSEPVLLVIQARGLRYVVVHGTRVPADSCQVSVVVLDAQTTVRICVDSDGESTSVDAQMLFVRESARYAACVGHNVSSSGTSRTQKAGLFIEDN